ncbi:helix-turn-helix transcriptional regulator [Glaciibacter superstes]|uniref:helix-turn-helix transcriptional regulator n=1 Tax=Glaciibacter superstes TaxID=501023 RepID=UPI0003B6E229|nr:AAA family ATPase [Glaciibacter superstes]
MTTRPGVIGPVLVGRTGELGVVSALLNRAAAGEAGAMLIFGDAGVGKTTLVQRACASAGSSALVLFGACLPLTSMTVPFLAIRSAVRGARSAGIALPPVITPGDAPANVPIAFDAWLDDLCRDRLVVLVIDDLHWTDQSTLDVLTYLLAGPAERGLAVVVTIRSGEVSGGHPLQNWLADIRRLPRNEQLTLDPLDRAATGEQLSHLLGAPPHQSLVEDVFTHTRGNPYLNRLVVNDLTPNTRHLPPDLPPDLRSAVLQSWRRLSSPTRELTRTLAVGGGPLTAGDLTDVTGSTLGAEHVVPLLGEAVDAGLLDAARDGRYWFHHPLTAEVLEQTMNDVDRERWHSAFARHFEKRVTDAAVPAVETMVAVAEHQFRAGHHAEAYRWAIRAADAAESAGATAEMLRLLRRAADLRPALSTADQSTQELLTRLAAAAGAAGAHEEELRAVDALLERSDPGTQPLLVAELMVRRMHLRFSTGRSFLSPDDMREAVRLSGVEPASWQHALALAELAHAGIWQDDADAAENAHRALALAQAAGNPRALSYALSANSMVVFIAGQSQQALSFATAAVAAAALARDYWAYCHATLWEANALEMWSSGTYADHLRMRREQLAELGGPHAYIAMLSADEASSWLAIGEWRECLSRLRVALGSDPGPFADVSARLAAARLAAWQGRVEEAQAHLARADELFEESSGFLNFTFDANRAEVLLAAKDPAAAFDAAMAGANSPGVPPTMCEWLMPLASRALADQVQECRDAGWDTAVLLARVDDLLTRFPHVIRDFGESTELWDLQISALEDMYLAEVGRARQVLENDLQWVRAADACRTAMLAWEEVYACWRGAEALLLHGHHREPAASILRRGLALARVLEARPIERELEALALSARIPIGVFTHAAVLASKPTGELAELTVREREILDHVIAGRTYGEIARSLVISEKTVSSHISNLLRKTGTSNRIDLARLAMTAMGRSDAASGDPPAPPGV